jgi:hypothetical protein
MPADKYTGAFIDTGSLNVKLNNDFSIFAELMINHPDKFIGYFGKHKLFFDFIFSLNESEISKITYQPEHLKSLFFELLEILRTREGFPIQAFHCFRYEDLMESTCLYVNLSGRELNKIVEGKTYHNDSNYDLTTSFDKWNNYSENGGVFKQQNTFAYIRTEEGMSFRSNLNLSAFPGEININRTQSNINPGREVKKVYLILKTHYEHLAAMFNNLIEVCNVCIDRGYGVKSYVSC